MDQLRRKRIAVVGVSDDPDKYGHRIFRDMLKAGYPVEAVNPKGGSVLGRRRYRNLGEITPKPDMVIAVVPPEATEKVLEECRLLGIGELWLQPGSGSPEVQEKAEKYGIRTVSACFMAEKGIW
ncbi:MAG TPA: CoA-binding protein [Elusimicrobiales bacterium]|nr:CoA-binding protein [Elusimicrobiales bacterium]